jgi:hypothetical protein
MPAGPYIFVSDQGRVFSVADAPTAEDFAFAAVGMVTIVRLADAHYYGRDRRWRPIPPGQLGSAEFEGEESPPYHALSSDFADAPNFS